jgi:hypothetical protein
MTLTSGHCGAPDSTLFLFGLLCDERASCDSFKVGSLSGIVALCSYVRLRYSLIPDAPGSCLRSVTSLFRVRVEFLLLYR